MGASALRDRDAARVQLEAAIPERMTAALGAMTVVAEASATQRIKLRAGSSHATSSIPSGVGENSGDRDGTPSPDRSLFDHFAYKWNHAGSFFQRRVVCYEAERELQELRRAPASLNSQALESAILHVRNVGVDALELAVRFRTSLTFVRWLRQQDNCDPDWGWRAT